ncbi:MAG TPA: hypothetical protein VMU54_09315 [Planctomycetota bacterium]|nr:hypothetical protein [Planctomycetota bacterium]
MAKKTSTAKPKTRRTPARRGAELAAPQNLLEVTIDYPQEGEIVQPGQYAVRVTAVGASSVQVRVNEADWIDCRRALGHFWYDWAPGEGPARLAARARVDEGPWSLASERVCAVAEPTPSGDVA